MAHRTADMQPSLLRTLAGLCTVTMTSIVLAQATPPIPRFIEETDTAGLQSRFEGEGEFMVGGGVAVFDCDADGLPEVYVTAGVNKARFYRHRVGCGCGKSGPC